MKCPNCGFEFNEEAYECPRCGIVFAKWEERQAMKAEGLLEEPAWYQRHISPASRFLRILGGLLSLGLATLLLLQGIMLSSFWIFLLMSFYLFFGLYILVSFKQRVTMGRFALEAIALLGAAAMAFVIAPGSVALNKPMYHSTTKPFVPANVLTYISAANKACSNVDRFINIKTVKNDDRAAILARNIDIRFVDAAFHALSAKDQTRFAESHAMLHGLEPMLTTLQSRIPQYMPKGPAVWLPDTLKESIRNHIRKTRIQIASEKARLELIYRFDTGTTKRPKKNRASSQK